MDACKATQHRVAVFDQGQLSGTDPVILELVKHLKQFEEAAEELENAEEQLQHVLTSLFAQYTEEEAIAMLDQIGETTGIDTEPFKPQDSGSTVNYIS